MALVSCSATKPLARLADTYCIPSVKYNYKPDLLPNPAVQALLRTDSSLTRRYTQHDLLLANATGVLPLLRELTALEQLAGQEVRLAILEKRQQILNRLLLASTQIAGFAAELDCEGERADQIATYLDQRDTRRIRRLTILSVVIGAATTVATTLIQADEATKAVGIGGGVISAGFGGLAAFSSNRTVFVNHPRNLLADIWYRPNHSAVYPPVVWYVLNEKLFSNEGRYSISHNIRQRWEAYVLNDTSNDQQQVYFGKGGNYQADDLHNRANMLNQLQSSVRSIDQDLQSLILAIAQ
ncbi:hypothetical protein GCM10028773_15390 [Spirosoma koreense]